MRGTIFALVSALSAGAAMAVDNYDDCVAAIDADAAEAERDATAWAERGGGAAARHCRALALIAIGARSSAIDELLGIAAEEPDLPDEARAEVLVQAGEMLLEVGDSVTAGAVAQQALALAPRDPDAAGLGAAARLANGDAEGALAEIGRAGSPGAALPPRLLVLRAAAQRRLGRTVAARDDALQATERAPEMPEAWLERGRAAAALGDVGDARDAFLRAIELGRGGRLETAARIALQRMEAGIPE